MTPGSVSEAPALAALEAVLSGDTVGLELEVLATGEAMTMTRSALLVASLLLIRLAEVTGRPAGELLADLHPSTDHAVDDRERSSP
jgi:hypothetical protein